jgi:predicted nucleic acid-binding protein
MNKSLDIPPQVLARARELTHAMTDEEAILRALKAFNARGEAIARDDDPPTCQADLIKYLGTFNDFMTPEQLDAMRAMD